MRCIDFAGVYGYASLVSSLAKHTHQRLLGAHDPDCPPCMGYPCSLLSGVLTFTDVAAACNDVNVAVMVGGYPRKAGEERKDVMAKNVSIYKSQASALAENAAKDVKVCCCPCVPCTLDTPVQADRGQPVSARP